MNKKVGFLIVFLFVLFIQSSNAQVGKVGISFSGFKNAKMLLSGEVKNDFETISSGNYNSWSLDYWYPLNKQFTAETGLSFSSMNFEKTYSYKENELSNVFLLNIPVGIRYNFLKYGFANTGAMLDLTHHFGLGYYFGIGARFESEMGIGFFINPFVKVHSVLPFDFKMNSDRIMETGIKIGITYSFKNNIKTFFNK